MSMEIERKFLLPQFPKELIISGEMVVHLEQRIEQTYLAMDDNEELRVRRIVEQPSGEISYTHTFKKGNGLVREEVEYEVSEGIYNQVVAAFGFKPLTKDRVTAKWNDITVEIDNYDQIQLTVLEVEFSSLDEANAFQAPAWFGEDISSQKQYSNKTVWKQLQGEKWQGK
ncbi:CYTH domain-containing protein [Paenibacillus sp. GSMTC-2017]|uniref:CYTH domain-containing protein n=1 Tax=Paenibacillus sp. GSMTC-2017 TaxID=2794350 RepID=UPI0018D953AB|nr:CYTH domain-containing protein [Paenibacillus sp. GSMTC-2017]MBH5319966.1 CYTH domain-containing protein [Paenibacillus sp. GSMTC-2017]